MKKFTALTRGLSIREYTLFELVSNPAAFAAGKKYVFDHLAAGDFKPRIDKVFPLNEIVAAHRYMEANAQIGKIVVTVQSGREPAALVGRDWCRSGRDAGPSIAFGARARQTPLRMALLFLFRGYGT